jgi:hypothetical protein
MLLYGCIRQSSFFYHAVYWIFQCYLEIFYYLHIGLRKISKYYLNLLYCRSAFLSLNKINTRENIVEQHIFGNSKIIYTCKRKAQFLSNFSKSGFITVKDIWDVNSKIFLNNTEIFNTLRDKRNWIAEYSRIKASFSHELLLMLKSDKH